MKKLYPLHIETSQINSILYSIDYFRARLSVEKRRSERLGTRSAIVILNIPVKLDKNERYLLLDIIYAALRESDVVCQFKRTVLLLLLPDTTTDGAEVVMQRVVEKILAFQLKSSHLQELVTDKMHWEIIVYPNDNIDETFHIKKNKLVQEALAKSKNHKQAESANKKRLVNFAKTASQNLFTLLNKTWLTSTVLFLAHGLNPQYRFRIGSSVKRIIDIILALLALIFFFPLLVSISLLIKLTSSGSIVFKQQRVGYTGKTFTLYKFRTMYADTSEDEHKKYMERFINNNGTDLNNGTEDKPLFKMKNDPRVTPVGRALRKLSLDELPQLLNVLKGDMSIVGPRPPIPYEVSNYKIWHHRRFLEAKPGITGLWQVSGRNSIEFDDMVRLDIKYAKNWSLFMDLKILAKTIGSMSTGR